MHNARQGNDCMRKKQIQGVVTSINTNLLVFTIDDVHSINIGYLLSGDTNLGLPNVGDHVTVKNVHYNESYICYLCDKSEIKITRNTKYIHNYHHKSSLADLIRTWKLGVTDLAEIHSTYVRLQSYFKGYELSVEEMTVQLVKLILKTSSSLTLSDATSCMNKILPSFKLKAVCDCRFVDIISTEYGEFPYWSFGVHPSIKNEFLVGYLYIHPRYGTFMLRDPNYQILCLILNRPEALENFVDGFVLISKYLVITEIYNASNVHNLEYIVVDFSNIEVLQQSNNMCIEYNPDTIPNIKLNMTFQLEGISVTILSRDNKPERWLQLSVIYCDNSSSEKKVLLCARGNVMKSLSFLTLGHHYKLSCNGALQRESNNEFKRFYPNYEQWSLPEQQVDFKLDQSVQPPEEALMNVSRCKAYIATFPKGLVSFKGRIKTKKFANAISSRTARQVNVFGFGTPGSKTHFIEFEVEESDVKTLSVYINNWESSIMPFGLVPGVVVAVRNVSHQKGKYCKSTPFTSFDVLGYEPDVKFTTANLFSGSMTGWGVPFHYSRGLKVPYGVLVWSNVESLWIRSLKIISKCSNHGSVVSSCECPNANTTPVFTMSLIVEDLFGTAKIISSCSDLLRLLLDFQPHEWETWMEAFRSIGTYEFNTESIDRRPEHLLFCRVLTNAINVVNAVGICNIKLLCRKMDSKDNLDPTEPVWYCIKAQKC